jgi:hypothetical protein
MFDRVDASLQNQKSNRDSAADSLLGVSDSQRRLAFQLNVDPYTDFPPLQNRLQEMSRIMAGGQLTVRAGLAAVTGGIGMGISAATSLEGAKEMLRDKTAAQVIVVQKPAEVAWRARRAGDPARQAEFTIIPVGDVATWCNNAQNDRLLERAAEANSYGVACFQWPAVFWRRGLDPSPSCRSRGAVNHAQHCGRAVAGRSPGPMRRGARSSRQRRLRRRSPVASGVATTGRDSARRREILGWQISIKRLR